MKDTNHIHIAVAINDAYFMPLYVSLYSLYHNTNSSCHIHVLYENLGHEAQAQLKELTQRYGQQIDFIRVDIKIANHLEYAKNWCNEITYKMFLSELFPKLNKIIWIDADTLIMGDIKRLWVIDIESYAIAAVEDSVSKEMPKRGLNWNKPYFNVGVLLLNLAYIRRHNLTEEINRVITTTPSSKLWLPEQDILNLAFKGRVKQIDATFNAQNAFYWKKAFKYNGVDQNALFASTPLVVHFTSKSKPWHKRCYHPYATKWREYASRASFRMNYTLSLFDKLKLFMKKYEYIFKRYHLFPTYIDLMVDSSNIDDLKS